MTFIEKLEIEHACTRLCADFARHVDGCEPALCAGLFTADGVYERRGEALIGREAIERALAARSSQRVSRHLVHNIAIDVLDTHHARGHSAFTLYAGDCEHLAAPGVPAQPLLLPAALVAEFSDSYLLTPEGWRIARRTGRTVFRSP
jgi:hypothetical protein